MFSIRKAKSGSTDGAPATPAEALRAQSTAEPPSIAFDTAQARLEAFAEATLRLPPEQAKRRIDRNVQDAALAYLTYRLTPLAPDHVAPGGSYRASMQAAATVAESFDEAHRQQLIDRVLFNLNDPSALQSLAPMIHRAVPAREMERAILRHLSSDNELHLHNALQIPYFLYGRRADYRLSPTAAEAFEARVAELLRCASLNPLVRDRLRTARLPAR